MRVAQIVHTIIGEGLFVGEPCLLIRLSGCNLHCDWCDTPEAHRGGSEIPLGKLVDRGIMSSQRWILLTGGEPLMQRSTGKLVQRWLEGNKRILIETNGSLSVERVAIDGICLSVDVKTPSSGECGKFLNKNIRFLRSCDCLKFVIADRKDFLWAKNFILDTQTDATLIFQPVWGRLSPKRLAQWIIESELPVRLGIQMHKMIKMQ